MQQSNTNTCSICSTINVAKNVIKTQDQLKNSWKEVFVLGSLIDTRYFNIYTWCITQRAIVTIAILSIFILTGEVSRS